MTESLQHLRDKFSELFTLADNFLHWCEIFLKGLKISSENLRQILVSILFVRVLSNFKALVILSEKGLAPETRIMARALVESVFILAAMVRNPILVHDYVLEDECSRLKFIRKFKQLHKGEWPLYMPKSEIETLEAQLQAEINHKNIRIRSTEEWAREAGMLDFYLTAYSIYSASVHGKVRDLEGYLKLNAQGKVIGFDLNRDDDTIKLTLMSTIEAILNAVKCISTLFDQNNDIFISDTHNKLKSFYDNSVV